jgi:hypothetical protein
MTAEARRRQTDSEDNNEGSVPSSELGNITTDSDFQFFLYRFLNLI